MSYERSSTAPSAAGRTRRSSWLGPSCLALLAFAGPLKASPLLSWLPFDLTFAIAVLVALATVASRFREGPAHRTIAIPLLLLVSLLLGIAPSSLGDYSQDKVLGLYTITTLSILAPFYLLRFRAQVTALLATFVSLAMVVAAATVLSPGSVDEYSTIATLAGTNTISTGRMISAGAVVLLIVAIGSGVALRRRLLALALAAGLLIATLSTGSRGPFVAIGAAIFGVLLLAPMFRKYRVRALVAMILLALAVLFIGLRSGGDGVTRVFTVLTGEADNSVNVRTYLADQALRSIAQNPFGLGFGDLNEISGVWQYAVSDRLYPHNVPIEIFAEAGWIPGVILIIYMIVAFVSSAKSSLEARSTAVFALLLFSVVNALTSGDVNDNRFMWVMLSGAIATLVWGRSSTHAPDPLFGRAQSEQSFVRPRTRGRATFG